MSQSAFNIPNESGAAFRGDVNTALQALASLSAGTTAPTTTYAYQLWTDTSGSHPILKIRNGANSAWITVGQADLTNMGFVTLAAGGVLAAAISFSNTDYLGLPVGSTAQRPGSPAAGMMRYNSDLSIFEGYRAGAWNTLGGGGSGGSLRWVAGSNAPISSIDSAGNEVYLFTSGLGQTLFAAVKVPHGYTAGSQAKLLLPFYSPDITGTALLTTVSTLIRPGTTAITSTTNQRTSTNTAITLSSGTAIIPQLVTFDLTDTTGKINSVAVAADDVILVALSRGSDTGTSDLSALVYGAEATFN